MLQMVHEPQRFQGETRRLALLAFSRRQLLSAAQGQVCCKAQLLNMEGPRMLLQLVPLLQVT